MTRASEGFCMQWFRWYHGTCSDPKFGSIARKVGTSRERAIAVWAMLLESASEAAERGRVEIDAEGIADCLNCDTESVERLLAEMEKRGMVKAGAIVKWEERQRPTDTSAERVKRHRAKKKPKARNVTVTVTPESVTGPEVERDRELEKETDTATTIIALRGRVANDREAHADRIMRAANGGMKANPALSDFKPIGTGHPSRQTVMDWLAVGVPADFAVLEVEGKARDYRPAAHGDQIHSMKYFDRAVRDAWRLDQTEVSDGADDRGAGAEARGAKPSKYDAVTEDGGTGLTVAEMRLRAG